MKYKKEIDKMKKESEFKVDKLGYYKDAGERIHKVVYIRNNISNRKFPIFAIYLLNEESFIFTSKGRFYDDGRESEFDLIKYLGEELPVKKEPRVFDFETNTDKKDFTLNIKVLGNEYHADSEYAGNDTTKWQVTMKEVIE